MIIVIPETFCICSTPQAVATVQDNTGRADKSLAQPGRKQATATEDFEFHISYL